MLQKNESLQEVEWQNMLGNPYRYGLTPYMLLPNGYRYTTTVRIKGQGKSEDKIPAIICFDEDYVVSYIQTLILEKLQPTSYNDFQKIISKAWKSWQSSEQ